MQTVPVATTLVQIEADWRRTGAYHFERADPNNEWDGEFWWSNVDGRTGLVLGFLSCQAEAGQKVSNAPVPALVAWIDHWYGVDPAGRDSDMQGPRMNEKLSTAILAAERANP